MTDFILYYFLVYRRGEDPDEPDKPKGRPQKEAAPKAVRDVWQQPKKKTPKVKSEYKTYEQIVADVGGEPEGVGLLIDLSGKAVSSSLVFLSPLIYEIPNRSFDFLVLVIF